MQNFSYIFWILQFLQAGPGTIAEAMIRGLPIILNGYIAGQVIFLTIHEYPTGLFMDNATIVVCDKFMFRRFQSRAFYP